MLYFVRMYYMIWLTRYEFDLGVMTALNFSKEPSDTPAYRDK